MTIRLHDGWHPTVVGWVLSPVQSYAGRFSR